MGHKEIFNEIYKNNIWWSGSGRGSAAELTSGYRSFIQEFIHMNNVRSVLDLGCGDWQFSRLIDWSGIDYVGVDVSDVVLSNTKQYAAENIKFWDANGLEDDLPLSDLLIVKDVIQHWSNDEIMSFIPKLSRFKYALITNGFQEIAENSSNYDIQPGGFRRLDLVKSPFFLKGSYIYQFYADEHKRVFLYQT